MAVDFLTADRRRRVVCHVIAAETVWIVVVASHAVNTVTVC
jgi:hypothetical protein